jgi:uncharacterized protein (DUF697 family)
MRMAAAAATTPTDSAKPAATEDAAAAVVLSAEERTKLGLAADSIIKNYVIGAVSVGIVPVPFVDIAGATALQLRMIKKLSDLYKQDFSEEIVRSIIASLGGGFLGYGAGILALSAIKTVPGIGWMMGMMSVPVFLGASTYAIGKVFAKHFDTGKTIFDLNVEAVKEFHREQMEKGKAIAKAAAGKSSSAAA